MLLSHLVAASSLLFLGPGHASRSPEARDSPKKRVAIIGAGAAGSSAAYHLQQFAEKDGVDVDITVFEKTDHIGGRTLTVDVYGDKDLPVEFGASLFVKKNHILYDATEKFGLKRDTHGGSGNEGTGIWDGHSFVFQTKGDISKWWTVAKMFWRYGTAPIRTQMQVQATVNKFLEMYEAPNFPFDSLTDVARDLDLDKVVGITGKDFLQQHKLDGGFAHDMVQVGTRVNYAQNLDRIHGLATMVSMATAGAMSVQGGNWQIFSEMVKASGAAMRLNTTVTEIGRDFKAGRTGSAAKYTVKTRSSSGFPAQKDEEVFDRVIVATPYQFSGIKTKTLQKIEEVPYVKLHVTLFATPLRFSPNFFLSRNGAQVPLEVHTTLAEDEDGIEGVGNTGFYSASLVKKVKNPHTGQKEFVYKVFSPKALTADFLTHLLGETVPRSILIGDPADRKGPISWYHSDVFHPYTVEQPRTDFQGPYIGTGAYYTSGMEGFISTMETMALMGKNVARLMVNDLKKGGED